MIEGAASATPETGEARSCGSVTSAGCTTACPCLPAQSDRLLKKKIIKSLAAHASPGKAAIHSGPSLALSRLLCPPRINRGAVSPTGFYPQLSAPAAPALPCFSQTPQFWMGIHNFCARAAGGRGMDTQVPFLTVVRKEKGVITDNVGLKTTNNVNTHTDTRHC